MEWQLSWRLNALGFTLFVLTVKRQLRDKPTAIHW
jgi:hypothetical protein